MGNLFRTGGGNPPDHPIFMDYFAVPFTFRVYNSTNDITPSMVDNRYVKIPINDNTTGWTFANTIVSYGTDLTNINKINVKIKQLKITGDYEFVIGVSTGQRLGHGGSEWIVSGLPTILKYRSNITDGVLSADISSYKGIYYIYIGVRCIYLNNQKTGSAEVLISDITFE